MVTETLSDEERQLIIVMIARAHAIIKDDPGMLYEIHECESIIRKLSGAKTRVFTVRPYPSTGDSP